MPPIAPSGWDIKPLLLKKDVGSSWKRNRLLVFPIWRRSPCTDSPAAASSLRVPSLVCVRPRIVVGPSVAARKRKTDDRWGLRKRQNPTTRQRSSGRPLRTYRPRCSGLTAWEGVINGDGPDY